MKIEISFPDKRYFHRIVIDDDEVENVLDLSTDKLERINAFILQNLCTSAFEDLFLDIDSELFYRKEEL